MTEWLRAPSSYKSASPGHTRPTILIEVFLSIYNDIKFPHRAASQRELEKQPKMHKQLRQSMIDFNIDSVAWRESLTDDDIQLLDRYYSANVSMIDCQVGQIVSTFRTAGIP